jgi:A/G-specific adenine glycosylase
MAFAHHIVAWQRRHGRHHLPWQNTTDPYRIWLSEIMLQQTQVATAIGYYGRFLARFPDVAALAAAEPDAVMSSWAGLGYYARARNLHKCAQTIVREWGGRFPLTAEAIATLPGIGPSTAAAIAAFAYGEAAPIMDGNVKRVFTRYFGIEGDPARREVEQQLWRQAHVEVQPTLAGQVNMPAYTQGLMDLGALVCTRRQPACERCPVAAQCVAALEGRQHSLPTPRTKRVLPTRETRLLVCVDNSHVLLTLRPSPGIWGGLWSLPECSINTDPTLAASALGLTATKHLALATFEHVFTHFRLRIEPWLLSVPMRHQAQAPMRWIAHNSLDQVGLPAPVKKLLDGVLANDLAACIVAPP